MFQSHQVARSQNPCHKVPNHLFQVECISPCKVQMFANYVFLLIFFKAGMACDGTKPSEFIDKLLCMLNKHKDIISWNQTETQIVIKDLKRMADVVIPAFFRHSKYESFVRQLNMYNFHKVCREKNNTINFKNDIFFKGNQQNFFRIKRKKKNQDRFEPENSEEQIRYIEQQSSLPSEFKQLIIKLIGYKADAMAHSYQLRAFFSDISMDLRTPKFRKFDKDISEIKAVMQNIHEKSEDIDELFSKKPLTDFPTQSQQRTDQTLSVTPNKTTMVEAGDMVSPGTVTNLCHQLSIQKLPERNSFHIFKTKVNFMEILNRPDRWPSMEEDRLSACSIENDIDT